MTLEQDRVDTGTTEVAVTVNERPVIVQGPRLTGRQIKDAAIAQGVPIELDFVLSLKLGEGNKRKNIGDGDPVTVNKNSVFIAIDNDDDSR
jgi:hypothetical protein